MNYYFWSAAVNAVTSFSVAALILSKNRQAKANKAFIVFALSVGLWATFYALWIWSMEYSTAFAGLINIRLAMIASTIIPPAFTEFVFFFLNKADKFRFSRRLNIACGIIILLFSFSNYFIIDVHSIAGFSYWPIPGPLFYFFHIWFALNVIAAHVFLMQALFTHRLDLNRKRVFGVFAGTLIGFIGGMTNHFLWYGIEIPPFGNILVAVYVATVAFSIIRYRLFDLEVIIKKTLVFAGLFTMIMAVVTGVSTVTQDILGKYLSIPGTLGTLISVVIAIFLYEPAKNLLIHATDKYLLQKKLDFKVVLNRLSSEVITILDIDKAGSTILTTLKTTLRLDSGVLYIKDENENDYRILESFGADMAPKRIFKENIILPFLIETKRMINLENPDEKKALPIEVSGILESCKAAVTIPLFIHTDLIGILMLGKKQSDQEFNQDEISFFPTLAGQVAIALSNARLYDLLKKSQIDFAQQAKMAAIGTLSAGISHEIKNPLNHIKVGISMLRMNKKHGVLDQMERYKMEEEVFNTLEILDQNVTRANEVIERLSSFAKKPKELKIEPVDLRQAVEMAYSFVKNEYEHHQIEIVKDFPEHLPLVNGDLHTFEDVFLNLLVNARHAIVDRGKVTVSARVTDEMLDLSIKDTGKGISKENLGKIWDPFFTTKDVSRNPDQSAVKGSGLGLFIVREFIQRFGGNITVESELGRGTTFHVIFPEAVWAK